MLVPVTLLLGLALTASPEPEAPTPVAEEPTQPSSIEVVLLDVDDPLRPALIDALSLRLDGMSLETFGARPLGEEPRGHAYVRIGAPEQEAYAIEIVVSDGRAYQREVVAPEDMAGRILGSELALLLRGIEEGTLAPDRRDGVIPPPDHEGDDTAEVGDETPPPEPEEEPVDEQPAPARLELGVRVAPGGLFGVAPVGHVARSGAGLAMAGLDLRWPSGGTLSADLRLGGRRFAPYSILRTRIAVGGGFVLRRGSFELPVLAMVSLEPWGVRAEGRGTAVRPVAGAARQVPLLGMVARAAPGARVSLAGRPSVLMRLGPFVELSGSAAFSDGVGVPRLRDAATGEVLARLGGLELALGLCVQMWLGIGRGPPRNRSPSEDPVTSRRPPPVVYGQPPASVQITSPPMRSHSQHWLRSPPHSGHGHIAQPGSGW